MAFILYGVRAQRAQGAPVGPSEDIVAQEVHSGHQRHLDMIWGGVGHEIGRDMGRETGHQGHLDMIWGGVGHEIGHGTV